MPTKKQRKKSATPMESLPDEVYQLIRDLDLAGPAAYLDWCRTHGFGAHFRKSRFQCRAEWLHAKELEDAASLRRARRAHRPNQVLQRILAGSADADLDGELAAVQRQLQDRRAPVRQRMFLRAVLEFLSKRYPEMLWEPLGPGADAGCYLGVVLRMGRYHGRVVRQVAAWHARTKNNRRRFASLVRHLFAQWEVPRFLDHAWLEPGAEGDRHREWFLHIGAGNSVRTLDLPIDFTRKMAHQFLRAPDDCTVVEALRWGQIHGLGGDQRVFEGLRGTPVCATFEHEEFWSTVLRFFIRHPMLDTGHYGPIVDYLNNQRFVGDELLDRDGRVRRLPPPQPNLTMRGRTPATLLEQVAAWHRRLGRGGQVARRCVWPASGYQPLESVEGTGKNQRTWIIRELLSSEQLEVEGRRMQHCVATYAHSCRSRRSSIWALELEDREGVHKVLTIEVMNSARRIVQARGRRNATPSAQARGVMARWAAAAGLTIASWV